MTGASLVGHQALEHRQRVIRAGAREWPAGAVLSCRSPGGLCPTRRRKFTLMQEIIPGCMICEVLLVLALVLCGFMSSFGFISGVV